MERPVKVKHCEVCGVEYETRSYNAKYCAACAVSQRKKAALASAKRLYWADVEARRAAARQHYKENKDLYRRYHATYYAKHKKEILAKRTPRNLTEEQRQHRRDYQREYKREYRRAQKEREKEKQNEND